MLSSTGDYEWIKMLISYDIKSSMVPRVYITWRRFSSPW